MNTKNIKLPALIISSCVAGTMLYNFHSNLTDNLDRANQESSSMKKSTGNLIESFNAFKLTSQKGTDEVGQALDDLQNTINNSGANSVNTPQTLTP